MTVGTRLGRIQRAGQAGLHLREVLGSAERLRIDLVDVLGARRSGGEPRRFGRDLQAADRGAVLDLGAGLARNAAVVASNPPGLYDAYVLKHAERYSEPRGVTVRGCVMTIDVKF